MKDLKKESSEAKAALLRLELAEQKYQRARARRLKRYQTIRQEAIDLRATAEWFSRVYRTENLRARPDGRPKCFDLDPPAASIVLPDVFKEHEVQDWECPEPAEKGGTAGGGVVLKSDSETSATDG